MKSPYDPAKDYDSHEKWLSGYEKAKRRIQRGGPEMMTRLKWYASEDFVPAFREGVMAAIDEFCGSFGG